MSVLAALSLTRDPDIFASDPWTGALGQRLTENKLEGDIPAPVLIAQGLNDPLVLPEVQSQYAQSRCGAGQPLEYRTYARRGHVDLVAADSPLIPDLIAWTRARFIAEPWTGGCPGARENVLPSGCGGCSLDALRHMDAERHST